MLLGMNDDGTIPGPLMGAAAWLAALRPELAGDFAATNADGLAQAGVEALHSYYEPVRQRTPRRYSVPHGFRRPGRSLSPPTPGQPYRGTPSHVPRKSSRPGSRRLHAGHHLAGKRTPSRLIPGLSTGPGSDASPACYDTSTATTHVFLIPA